MKAELEEARKMLARYAQANYKLDVTTEELRRENDRLRHEAKSKNNVRGIRMGMSPEH